MEVASGFENVVATDVEITFSIVNAFEKVEPINIGKTKKRDINAISFQTYEQVTTFVIGI